MKKQTSFLLFLFLFLAATTSSLAQDQHFGLWRGEDGSDVGYLELDKEGWAVFIIQGDTLGGPSFNLEGLEASMTYEIDYEQEPFAIDFVLSNNSDGTVMGRLPGIFEYLDEKSMRLCVNFQGPERPTTYVDEDTIIFERIGKSSKKKG